MSIMSLSNCPKGLYRHYKGSEYRVIDLVRHSETEEILVLYRPCYGDEALWVRPYEMFFESVVLGDGQSVPRFALVEEEKNKNIQAGE